MALPDSRLLDIHHHGGFLITASHNKVTSYKNTSRVTDLIICFQHGIHMVVTGSSNYLINGLQCARITSVCTCGAILIQGAPNEVTS